MLYLWYLNKAINFDMQFGFDFEILNVGTGEIFVNVQYMYIYVYLNICPALILIFYTPSWDRKALFSPYFS